MKTNCIFIKPNGEREVREIEIEDVPQPTADGQISALKSQLDEIDRQCVRPLRAIATGTATEFDGEKLYTLEQEALNIRNQIKELESEENENENRT